MDRPLVLRNDNGIRPAGKPDECFYCQSTVGSEHRPDCVTLSRRVRVKLTVEYDVFLPWSLDKEAVDFKFNESSWCKDNALNDLEKHFHDGKCMCEDARLEVVDISDERCFAQIAGVETEVERPSGGKMAP